MPESYVLRPGQLDLKAMHALAAGPCRVALAPESWPVVEESAAAIQRLIATGQSIYGVNTGFGSLATTRISTEQLVELQRNLLLSHAVGTGPLLPDNAVRLILLLKIGSLARGHSGVSRALIEALLALLNADVLPCIPAQGSVGASGDLAPLAHLSLALIGMGEVRVGGRAMSAAEGLMLAGLAPMDLAPKEGLALINGSQVSTALAAIGLFDTLDVFASALAAGALSVEAAAGSDVPFDPRIHAIRGQPGQIRVASALKELLRDSAIRASHIDCDRVQDPYSLRCQPQVMGAVLDLIEFAAGTIEREANGVSDNPLVFPAQGEILSGGNFHCEPIAFAADALAIALAEIGALSERRVALLVDKNMSQLPPFLIAKPGLNSGFMAAQISAAALAAENKALANPRSVDSLPTAANQEDHVSMAAHAARRVIEMTRNAAAIVAIELMAAAQGVDMRRPLATGPALKKVHDEVRKRVDYLESDRYLAPDIAALKDLVLAGTLRGLVPIELAG